MESTRRGFLTDLGRGMLIAGTGAALADDLGIPTAWSAEGPGRLTFARLEPLVAQLQETAPDKLLTAIAPRLRSAAGRREVVAAAALANARTFGGEDYVGFHTLMALAPAHEMARALPAERCALPILKVLYRNGARIQEFGGPNREVLHPVTPAEGGADPAAAHQLRALVRDRKVAQAEATFAAGPTGDAKALLERLLPTLHDGCEVHRVVLVSRAWDLLDLLGAEQAHTLLRQSVRYCVRNEPHSARHFGPVRALLPKLLERHRLLDAPRGTKKADDAWIDRMSRRLFTASAEDAAGIAAEALSDGIDPDAVAEAVCLAANQLVLRDEGRPKGQTTANKGIGSVHGDSIGVHACDSANAWRNLARVSSPRHAVASLILAAYQVALDRGDRGGDFLKWEPFPRADVREKVTAREPAALLKELDGAIREKNQPLAAALADRYSQLGHAPAALFDLLLRYAVSEDGALHAEKFYRTVSEEYAATRKPYRHRHLVALARVTASACGQPAPGYAQACALLKVTP